MKGISWIKYFVLIVVSVFFTYLISVLEVLFKGQFLNGKMGLPLRFDDSTLFGGGVINNMAGFLASTLYRGIGLIHFPTSTMAQVDAAIDFKQAVNSYLGKNLFGSYYPAKYIIIDPEVLTTLDTRHLVNGTKPMRADIMQ